MSDTEPVDDEFEQFRADLLGETPQTKKKKYETGPAFFGGRKEQFESATEDDAAKRKRLEAFEAKMARQAEERRQVKEEAERARVAALQEKRRAARMRMERALAERHAEERRRREEALQQAKLEESRIEASDPFARFAKENRKKPRKGQVEPQADVDPNVMFFGDRRTKLLTGGEELDASDAAKRERLKAFESQLQERKQAEARAAEQERRRELREKEERRRKARERMERAAARERAAKRQAQEEKQEREAAERAARLAREHARRALEKRRRADTAVDVQDPFVKFRQERARRPKAPVESPPPEHSPMVRKRSRRIKRQIVEESGARKGSAKSARKSSSKGAEGRRKNHSTSRRIPRSSL